MYFFNISESWYILLTILIGVLSVYLWNLTAYFRKNGIPYSSPLLIFGNMGSVVFRQKHFNDLIKDFYNCWPDAKYFGFYDFTTPVIIIKDPEIIKSIALKHFDSFPDHRVFFDEKTEPLFGNSLVGLKGAKWREVRQLLSPSFTAMKMKIMYELMSKCATNFTSYVINQAIKADSDIEMKDAFTRYTNDVIATCAFGISVDSMQNPNNDFYVMAKKITNFQSIVFIKMFFIRYCPYIARILGIRIFSLHITKFFRNIIETTINTREKEGIVRPDMLQLMMEARGKTNNVSKLSIEDMMSQAFIFFFGGFDSSATLMSFTSILLSVHPEIQKKLQTDIDDILKETNGKPTYEAISSMPYLEAVLYETMRMYPITGFIDRVCISSFELPPVSPGFEPVTIKPGMAVLFPIVGIHYDPKYYSNPDQFNPDRFVNKKMHINQSTYLAFGIGPRSCIANRFALLESKLVIFHLLAKCHLKLSHKTNIPLKLDKKFPGLSLEGGFWLKLVPRETNVNLTN